MLHDKASDQAANRLESLIVELFKQSTRVATTARPTVTN